MSRVSDQIKNNYKKLVRDYLDRLLDEENINSEECDVKDCDGDEDEKKRDIELCKGALDLARKIYEEITEWSTEKFSERYYDEGW